MSLCLGLVVLPEPGRMDDLVAVMRSLDELEIGEPQAHGLPISAVTEIGADEALLARLEALPPVLRVEVVFAQTLLEETTS